MSHFVNNTSVFALLVFSVADLEKVSCLQVDDNKRKLVATYCKQFLIVLF